MMHMITDVIQASYYVKVENELDYFIQEGQLCWKYPITLALVLV